MLKQKQRYLHDPDHGIIGDCHRTAFACILDLNRDLVPHWGEIYYNDTAEWTKAVNDWLRSIGYVLVSVPLTGSLETVLECANNMFNDAYWLLTGESSTHVNHVVVCCGGKIVHDPSLVDSGIIGPCIEERVYWCEFLTPFYS